MPNREIIQQVKSGENTNEVLETLVKKSINGDRAALYALCETIAKRVLFHAIYLVGNSADAEDVSQEVLLRVCEQIGTLRDPKAFIGWLGKITTNEVNTLFKKKSRHGVVLNIDDYLEGIVEENNDFLPQEYAEKEEYRQAVMDIIGTLPQRQQQAVWLYYYSGLSITETAREMGISSAGISKYLALAREKLKKEIKKSEFSHEKIMFNSMAAPTGMILANIMSREVDYSAISPEAVQRLLGKCDEFIKAGTTVATATTAATYAAAEAASAASATTAAAPGLTGVWTAITAASKTLALPIIGAISATAVTSGIIAGVQLSSSPTSQISEAKASGYIVFSGGMEAGDGLAYMNPTKAQPYFESNGGKSEVLEWWITESGGDAVLSSGKGDDIGDALVVVQDTHGDGGYMLYFRLKDTTGAVWKLGKNFMLMRNPN